jgi:hypothetical protein
MTKAKPKAKTKAVRHEVDLGPLNAAPPSPKPVREPDNGESPAFNALCDTVRTYLRDALVNAMDGPEKEKARAAYIAFAEVAITAKAGRGFAEGVAREAVELSVTVDSVHRAHVRGAERWREGHPDRELVSPDMADLTGWLLDRLADVEDELRAALKVRPSIVRMSDTVVGAPAAQAKEPPPASAVSGRRRERKRG